jgi:hypothetical protein
MASDGEIADLGEQMPIGMLVAGAAGNLSQSSRKAEPRGAIWGMSPIGALDADKARGNEGFPGSTTQGRHMAVQPAAVIIGFYFIQTSSRSVSRQPV